MSFQIAIDGPAGAGKSTVAKAVAAALHFIYVDTGAMYRAMGLYLDSLGIDPSDGERITEHCEDADIRLACSEGKQQIFLAGEDVTELIRSEKAGMLASATSVFPAVRRKLTLLQQQIASAENVVMDGRDIGTAVLPDAPLKIFLTASVDTRAQRRYLELRAKGQEADFEEIRKDIEDRDYRDSHREASPLSQAEDAVLIDSSDMTADEVTEKVLELYRERSR